MIDREFCLPKLLPQKLVVVCYYIDVREHPSVIPSMCGQENRPLTKGRRLLATRSSPWGRRDTWRYRAPRQCQRRRTLLQPSTNEPEDNFSRTDHKFIDEWMSKNKPKLTFFGVGSCSGQLAPLNESILAWRSIISQTWLASGYILLKSLSSEPAISTIHGIDNGTKIYAWPGKQTRFESLKHTKGKKKFFSRLSVKYESWKFLNPETQLPVFILNTEKLSCVYFRTSSFVTFSLSRRTRQTHPQSVIFPLLTIKQEPTLCRWTANNYAFIARQNNGQLANGHFPAQGKTKKNLPWYCGYLNKKVSNKIQALKRMPWRSISDLV